MQDSSGKGQADHISVSYTHLPKFRAAVEFLEKREGRSALITSFDKLDEALKGKTGTLIR